MGTERQGRIRASTSPQTDSSCSSWEPTARVSPSWMRQDGPGDTITISGEWRERVAVDGGVESVERAGMWWAVCSCDA